MADGRQKFETKEVTIFGGLNSSVDPTKETFPETDSPLIKNFFNTKGILEGRNGRVRLNSTRYDNEITSLVSYTDRSDVKHLVFSVKSTTADPVAPDGTIQETH
jgi:hypothetical protein